MTVFLDRSCCALKLNLCLQSFQLKMFLYLIIVVSELLTINASWQCLISVPLITRSSLRSWMELCLQSFCHKQNCLLPQFVSSFIWQRGAMQCQDVGHSFTSGQTRWGVWGRGLLCRPTGWKDGGRGIISPKIATTCT